jgi:hypothetical protein
MRTPDLSLRVSQRKQPCILDPTLVLVHAHGPALAMRLTQVLEPWLTRSFWQVIDASELLLRSRAEGSQDHGEVEEQPDASALATWIALRDNTDAASWPLRWVGDNLPESQIGDGARNDVLDRYEHLACALAERTESKLAGRNQWQSGMNPLLIAMDTVALSATLGGALVLSAVPPAGNGIPWPVQAMALAGLTAVRLDPLPVDTLFSNERLWLRDTLVSAGLAVLAQRLPHLAVFHVMANADFPAPLIDPLVDTQQRDPWAAAQGWWYLL